MSLFFEGDASKAVSNERKHAITFTEASSVFADRQILIMADPDHSEDEERFLAIGESHQRRLLLVVAKDVSHNRLSLTSARKATRSERNKYERR